MANYRVLREGGFEPFPSSPHQSVQNQSKVKENLRKNRSLGGCGSTHKVQENRGERWPKVKSFHLGLRGLKKEDWKVKCQFCPWTISAFRLGKSFRPEEALNDLRNHVV
jgi:hypothetical protein